MVTARVSRRAFFVVCAPLFAASAAATIRSCASMSSMGELPMPGGWAMSATWLPMCGQTWFDAAIGFVGMWSAMMVAMMLPVLMPMLRTYRVAVARVAPERADILTVLAGLVYFSVWTLLGIAVFTVGAAAVQMLLRHATLVRAVPFVVGAVVLTAGMLQFSAWKARRLACCRATRECAWRAPANIGGAWRHGLRMSLRCIGCCANLTAVLLAVGTTDLLAMTFVTAAIAAERLATNGVYIARIVGAVVVGTGLSLIAQAVLRPN